MLRSRHIVRSVAGQQALRGRAVDDLSTSTTIVLLLPEDFLLGAICAILLIDLFLKPSQRDITHWLSLGTLLVTIGLIMSGLGDHGAAAFSGMFLRDSMAAVLKVFILATTTAGRSSIRAATCATAGSSSASSICCACSRRSA